jgi:hypothetical protein
VSFVTKIFQGDFKGAINVIGETFSNLLSSVQNTFNKIRNTIIDGLKSILSNMKPILEAVGIDVDKLQKKLDGLKGKVIENKTKSFSEGATSSQGEKQEREKEKADLDAKIKADKLKAEQDKKNADENKKKLSEAQKAKEESQKKIDEAIKKETESAQKLADEKVKLANVELNSYIEKNKSILENEKYLTSELLKQEQERLKNLEKAKLDQEKLEFDTSNKILNDKITSIEKDKNLNQTQKNELETLKLQQKELELTYNSDVAKIKEETQKGITANETRYSNERIEAEKVRRAIKYQTELLDLEAKGASEQEILLKKLEQQREIEVTKLIETADAKTQAGIEKRLEEDALITEEDALREELKQQINLSKDENEKIRLQNQLDTLNGIKRNSGEKEKEIDRNVANAKLSAYASIFGSISELLGKDTMASKAAGLAQIGIAQGVAIAQIWKAPPAGVAPVDVATKIAGTATAGLTILNALRQVSSVQTPKAQRGMLTKGKSHAQGGIPAIVGGTTPIELEGGEAIINKNSTARFGNILSQINQAGGGVKFAKGGVVGSPIASLSNIQNQFTNQLNTEALTESIKMAVMEGSAVGTATGSQRGISDLNNNAYIASTANF